MEHLIQLKEIAKIYTVGDTIEMPALKSVTVDIARNEFVAITGPSGSGKSTLMNIIGCLDMPTRGTYILNEQDVSEMEDDELAEIRNHKIGFVFQTFNLLPRYDVLINVQLPLIYVGVNKAESTARALDAIKQVGLTDCINHKPNELSDEQRQRVAIARALVNKPSVILADEPTGNLDSKTSVSIMQLFSEIHRNGNTIILVTNKNDIARYAHRIICLNNGKIESDEANTAVRTN